jgi:hypothetical protein
MFLILRRKSGIHCHQSPASSQSPSTLTISEMSQSFNVIPAAIAGEAPLSLPPPLTSHEAEDRLSYRTPTANGPLASHLEPMDSGTGQSSWPLFPNRYSPLQTEVPTALAEVLIGLGQEVAQIALTARDVKPVSADDLDF